MATGCVNYKTEWNTAIAIEVLMEHRRAVWKLWAASHDLFIIIIIMIIIFKKYFYFKLTIERRLKERRVRIKKWCCNSLTTLQ